MTHAQRVEGWLRRCVVDANGCWIWPGAKFRGGYGNVGVVDADGRRRNAGLHRVAYEYLVGPIPERMDLDHVHERGCRSTSCCNPAHLEPVTRRENLLRGDTISARRAATTHCPAGHAYTDENTMRSSRGQRSCRACRRARRAKAAA